MIDLALQFTTLRTRLTRVGGYGVAFLDDIHLRSLYINLLIELRLKSIHRIITLFGEDIYQCLARAFECGSHDGLTSSVILCFRSLTSPWLSSSYRSLSLQPFHLNILVNTYQDVERIMAASTQVSESAYTESDHPHVPTTQRMGRKMPWTND